MLSSGVHCYSVIESQFHQSKFHSNVGLLLHFIFDFWGWSSHHVIEYINLALCSATQCWDIQGFVCKSENFLILWAASAEKPEMWQKKAEMCFQYMQNSFLDQVEKNVQTWNNNYWINKHKWAAEAMNKQIIICYFVSTLCFVFLCG